MGTMAERALNFAYVKHDNQQRIDGTPYITHPVEVARYVEYYLKNDKNIDQLKAAAYLHDTLEDTNTTFEELAYNFNYFVASLVLELTNDETIKKMISKKIYLSCKMANMSTYALTIKLADRLANVRDLINANESFRKKYIKETKYILGNLKQLCKLNDIQKQIVSDIYNVLSTYKYKHEKQKTRVLSLAS